MKNTQKWLGLVLVIVILIVIWAGFYYSSYSTKTGPVTITPLAGQDAISFYTNSQHGYGIAYTGNIQVKLAGAGNEGSDSEIYTPQDSLSTSTAWYASTCVQLTDASSTWFIHIAADSQFSQVACASTGTSADGHKEQDTLTVNGQRVTVIGNVEPNEASSVYTFSLSKNINVQYGVTNGNAQNYDTILSSANAVLSTLTLAPNFVPTQPPQGN